MNRILDCRNGKGLRLLGWGGNGEAVSAVEGISVDALAGGGDNTVDRIGWARSTLSADVIESSDTNAFKRAEVELLVGCACRSADGILSIIVVRGSTVGANSLDNVEAGQTDADIVDELLVD